jgi:hypothetical protein
MFLTYNKQNFDILQCVVVLLLAFVVYNYFTKDKLECTHCTGGHKNKERFTGRMKEGMGRMKEGMGRQKVEPYGNKRMYR